MTMKLLVASELQPAGGSSAPASKSSAGRRRVRPGDELRVELEVLEVPVFEIASGHRRRENAHDDLQPEERGGSGQRRQPDGAEEE